MALLKQKKYSSNREDRKMKLIKNILRIVIILLFIGTAYTVSAQPPPPPTGGTGGSNNQNNKLGGSAPIGGGLFILLGLGTAYGGRKIYYIKSKTTKN